MAEHILSKRQKRTHEKRVHDDSCPKGQGFDAMGKPIPTNRREAAYVMLKEIGVERIAAFSCAERVAQKLERDQPYDAIAEAMKDVDLTGAYRLLAVLLTEPAVQHAS